MSAVDKNGKQVVFPCDLPTWPQIKTQLKQLKSVTTLDDAFACMVKMNAIKDKKNTSELTIQQTCFHGLKKFFMKHAAPEESDMFITKTLPAIATFALSLEHLKPQDGLSYSQALVNYSVKLDRVFIASVLANAFLCLFPNLPESMSEKLQGINFGNFHTYLGAKSQQAKLRCILHYFERLIPYVNDVQKSDASLRKLKGKVAYYRSVCKPNKLLALEKLKASTTLLCPVEVITEGVIEYSGSDTLQVDFANSYIGGGVLLSGNVQEEIRFCICPELLVSLLFMECMQNNEAIIVQGFEQFSKYSGYGGSLKFDGDYMDLSERDVNGNLCTTLCAIDAVPYFFGDRAVQYNDSSLLRDLNKAYIGFNWEEICLGVLSESTRPVATGNWGCGVFGGNPQLKSLLQWIACSCAKSPRMLYYTFKDDRVKDLDNVVKNLTDKKWTVSDLLNVILEFTEKSKLILENERNDPCLFLFDMIKNATAFKTEC